MSNGLQESSAGVGGGVACNAEDLSEPIAEMVPPDSRVVDVAAVQRAHDGALQRLGDAVPKNRQVQVLQQNCTLLLPDW